MVNEVVWACVFTALCWWLGTGVILWLDRLNPRSFRFSLAGWTVLLALSFWGVAHSMREVSVANAYLAFGSVIVMWGWHELTFLTGWITGPRKTPLEAGAQGWPRFVQSVQVMLYHELALLANFALLWWMQEGQHNHVAICTYALLWFMRLSAKAEFVFWGAAKRCPIPAGAPEVFGQLFPHPPHDLVVCGVDGCGHGHLVLAGLAGAARRGGHHHRMGHAGDLARPGHRGTPHHDFSLATGTAVGLGHGPDHQTGVDHTPLKAPMNAYRSEGFDLPPSPAGPPPRIGVDPRPVAVVIGSGFGGLAAAIRLSAKGYQVKVLEKLDAPGGRAYVHHQDGFTFDAGPTIITAPFLLEEAVGLVRQTLCRRM